MVTLQSGETSLRSGPAVVHTEAGPRPGTLTVTTVALVFETSGAPPPNGEGWGPAGGPASNEYRIGLWRFRQAAPGPSPHGGQVLQVNLLARVLYIQVDDIPGWAATLAQAKSQAGPPPPEVQARRAAKKGLPPPPMRCSYCNGLSPPGSVKCTSCGAPF